MSLGFRKQIYVDFARHKNLSETKWIVLHGIEGYPNDIGRDLDVTFKGQADLKQMLSTFAACLSRHGVPWIVYPSPIWGRRVLGISRDYEVVELHTMSRARCFNVNVFPNWSERKFIEGIFPVESTVTFFKSCLMPALVSDKKWRCKCGEAKVTGRLPWWMARAAVKLRNGEAMTMGRKVCFFGGFFISHPIASIHNLGAWLKRKLQLYFQPTAPVYRIPSWMEKGTFEKLVRSRLGEIFLEVDCVDDFPWLQIRKMQSRQHMVFLTTADKRKLNSVELGKKQSNPEDLLMEVVEGFVHFSKRWGA